MSHEITMKKDGTAAALYSRKPAWHRLGDVTVEEFTAKEALERTGLDYGVETAPVYAEVLGPDGVVQQVEADAKMTYRWLDGKVHPLGVVGSDYVPINPNELFVFLDDVIDQVDGAHYTAAFALRNWTQVVCVADIGSLDLDPGGRADQIKRYIVGRTSHDGSLAFGLKWSNMRVECANMLAMHLRENAVEWKTKHTLKVRDRVAQAKVTLGLYQKYGEEWQVAAESMIEAEINAAQFDKWLGTLMVAQQKKQGDDEVDREAMHSIRALYEYSPTNAGIRGTVWGALNAATEYSDWVVPARGSKNTTEDESRFIRQMGDSSAKYGQGFKQTAWEWSALFIEEQIKTAAKKRDAKVKVAVR